MLHMAHMLSLPLFLLKGFVFGVTLVQFRFAARRILRQRDLFNGLLVILILGRGVG